MRVYLRLWAMMRIAAGAASLEIDLPDGARLSGALDLLYATHPELIPHGATARAAIGNEYVAGDPVLHEGDEISLIPPVQGG